jgi:transcriptional regulator with XRE-family HTH domain
MANRIKELRKAKGYTAEEFAPMIDVTIASLSKWENNKVEPRPAKRKQMADILGVTIPYLMGDTDDGAASVRDYYARVKSLSIARGIPVRILEERLGFANGSLRKWKTSNPGADKLISVADFFNVSVDYLLYRDNNDELIQHVDLASENIEFSYNGAQLSSKQVRTIKSIVGAYLISDFEGED